VSRLGGSDSDAVTVATARRAASRAEFKFTESTCQ
jgi:hypothetical protein